ncbi:hypothetical protein AADZ90_009295 [Aestuariibius sp. 2305UL40-4]|uniref:hypothetical protein n=1 Tax=Aestuariibius violaceus TaxID=3234132 RepID=UPI00345EE025
MAIAKIRIKVGTMELEYEGDPAFLTEGIEALLTTMGELSTQVPSEPASVTLPELKTNSSSGSKPTSVRDFNFSTNTIAAHLNAKTGPELVICAMAHLEFVQGKSTSSRTEILSEMKSANAYYNQNMSSNLSTTLTNLTKSKRINLVSGKTYSLSAAERKELETKIAQIG